MTDQVSTPHAVFLPRSRVSSFGRAAFALADRRALAPAVRAAARQRVGAARRARWRRRGRRRRLWRRRPRAMVRQHQPRTGRGAPARARASPGPSRAAPPLLLAAASREIASRLSPLAWSLAEPDRLVCLSLDRSGSLRRFVLSLTHVCSLGGARPVASHIGARATRRDSRNARGALAHHVVQLRAPAVAPAARARGYRGARARCEGEGSLAHTDDDDDDDDDDAPHERRRDARRRDRTW